MQHALLQNASKWLAACLIETAEKHAKRLCSDAETKMAHRRTEHYGRLLSKDVTDWNASKQLIEIRVDADEELRMLSKCKAAIWCAQVFGWNAKEFTNGFASELRRVLGDEPRRLEEAVDDLRKRQDSWKSIIKKIRRFRKPFTLMEVFYVLHERSGLELASLAIGVLLLLGALKMFFFYQAAADQFVHTYWTWDDIIIQGINIVLPAVLALFILEGLFRFYHSVCERLVLTQSTSTRQGIRRFPQRVAEVLGMTFLAFFLWFWRHQLLSALLVFLFFLFLASWWGYFKGIEVWREFDTDDGGQQVATVLDGTILRNVHLVGTTSRTAVFLQVTTELINPKDRENQNEQEKEQAGSTSDRPYTYAKVLKVLFCTLSGVCGTDTLKRFKANFCKLPRVCGIGVIKDFVEPRQKPRCQNEHQQRTNFSKESGLMRDIDLEQAEDNTDVKQCQILVLDRALIVCHSEGDACLELQNTSPLDKIKQILENRTSDFINSQPDGTLSS